MKNNKNTNTSGQKKTLKYNRVKELAEILCKRTTHKNSFPGLAQQITLCPNCRFLKHSKHPIDNQDIIFLLLPIRKTTTEIQNCFTCPCMLEISAYSDVPSEPLKRNGWIAAKKRSEKFSLATLLFWLSNLVASQQIAQHSLPL